jgi:feruloyl esterase
LYHQRNNKPIQTQPKIRIGDQLFMAPGMGHCADEFGTGSASSWDKLAPIVEWVENGVAPDAIVGTHQDADGNVDNERLICPWPLQPTYMGPTGDGAENDPANWVADNFECLPQE